MERRIMMKKLDYFGVVCEMVTVLEGGEPA